ncbi:MAG: DUF308 domain-containing protein [Clostridia bacterium]|nr:DUF308 domain-containing protein [Clostridia bacterium]
MKNLLKRTTRSITVWAVCTILLGLIMAFWPESSTRIICIVLGWAMLLGGIAWTFYHFSSANSTNSGFILGVVAIALGFWIVIHPTVVVQFIAVIFGIILLVNGFMLLQDSLELKQGNFAPWLMFLILGLVCSVLGIFVIWSPIVSSKVMTIIAGISLVIDGVSNILFVLRAAHLIRDLSIDR